MLMNNLDPTSRSGGRTSSVYGASGKAARSWEAYHAIVKTLRRLEADETLLVQSGKPVGVFRNSSRRAPRADRQRVARARVGRLEHFRQYEAMGLTMYGQMTAGSWIYIGTQGILQGTYETFRRLAAEALRRLAGGPARALRRARGNGRGAAARRHAERRRRALSSRLTPQSASSAGSGSVRRTA